MNIVQNWKQVVLERYAEFDGRASRAEYWWFVLANFVVAASFVVLANAAPVFFIAYVVWTLGTLIPALAAGVRRLHDTDRSGWFMAIALIPFVGLIVLVVFLATQGTPGPNQYGPPPVAYAAVAAT